MVISDTEKQRTAKEILCFIYLLDKKHLLSHLEGCDNVKNGIATSEIIEDYPDDLKTRKKR